MKNLLNNPHATFIYTRDVLQLGNSHSMSQIAVGSLLRNEKITKTFFFSNISLAEAFIIFI